MSDGMRHSYIPHTIIIMMDCVIPTFPINFQKN